MHLRNYLDHLQSDIDFQFDQILDAQTIFKALSYNPNIIQPLMIRQNDLLQKKFIWLAVLP